MSQVLRDALERQMLLGCTRSAVLYIMFDIIYIIYIGQNVVGG